MVFKPRFTITTETAHRLLHIGKAAAVVETLPLPASVLIDLQREVREATVILSTRLEGNSLDDRAMRRVMYDSASGSNAEEQEVHNLMKALDFLDEAESRELPVTEELIKKLHAIIRVIPGGRRAQLSEYRVEQNQVGRRNEAGFYLPPEPTDVPRLMEDLVAWINAPATLSIPAPITAGIFLHRLLTIHPYMDGNGRTGRMLATYILRRARLGLKGLFVLESYYDRHLREYYKHLQMDLHHNYYFGRHDADLTPWVSFFVKGLSEVFQEAANLVTVKNRENLALEPELLRLLDPSQRLVFAQLVFKADSLTTSDLQVLLQLSDRTVRDRIRTWIEQGFLVPRDEGAVRIRSIRLAPAYEALAEQMRIEPERYQHLLV